MSVVLAKRRVAVIVSPVFAITNKLPPVAHEIVSKVIVGCALYLLFLILSRLNFDHHSFWRVETNS